MSRIYYFASDHMLEEQHNPYVKHLSVNQALKMGIKVDVARFGEDFDWDKPEVILYCESEMLMEYPNIYSIKKDEFYDDIGTTKQYCTELQWSYSEDTVDVVLGYIHNHMNTAQELELWSVWLGYGELPTRKKSRCKVSELTAGRLKEFYTSEKDLHCLLIVRG